MRVVKTIEHPRDDTRRVEIFQRANGTYGFREWRYQPEYDVWVPYGIYSNAVTDTAERAEDEARGRVSWLQTN
jgi:hypothetical protein